MLSERDLEMIEGLLAGDATLRAIKHYRSCTGGSLKEVKAEIDFYVTYSAWSTVTLALVGGKDLAESLITDKVLPRGIDLSIPQMKRTLCDLVSDNNKEEADCIGIVCSNCALSTDTDKDFLIFIIGGNC